MSETRETILTGANAARFGLTQERRLNYGKSDIWHDMGEYTQVSGIARLKAWL
jgi:hypothetical protein